MRMEIAYDAFCETYASTWAQYLRTQVDDVDAVAVIVQAVRDDLWRCWEGVLREPVPVAHAWRLLKTHLATWRTLAPLPRQPRTDGELPSGPAGPAGSTPASARLPERQYDVLVLVDLLGLSAEEVGAFLGLAPAAVGTVLRQARQRMARHAAQSPAAVAGRPDGRGQGGADEPS